jgi:hypothetical protein
MLLWQSVVAVRPCWWESSEVVEKSVMGVSQSVRVSYTDPPTDSEN